MDDILLLGSVADGLSRAMTARGLNLVASRRPHCRAALVVRSGHGDSSCANLPYLALVRGDAALIAALDHGAADAADERSSDAVVAARLAALVRRAPPGIMLRLGDLAIDQVARRVTRSDRSIALLPREYALLLFLVGHAGTVVTRRALREAVWGLDFDPGTNVIEVHVSRLRAKLDRGFAVPMLRTEKGVGYRLVPVGGGDSPIAAAAIAG